MRVSFAVRVRRRLISNVSVMLILMAMLLSLAGVGHADEIHGQHPSSYALQALSQPVCAHFEHLPADALFTVDNVLVDASIVLTVHPLVWSDGTVYAGGHVTLGDEGLAGGSGRELLLDNAHLDIEFGDALTGLMLRFAHLGNINLEINGDFRNIPSLADVDGLTVGGVTVELSGGRGGAPGVLWLRSTGPGAAISTLALGGQDLALDDVCPEGHCVTMESLMDSQRFFVGDLFYDSGVQMRAAPFVRLDGTIISNGYVQVDTRGLAGGWGLDLELNNVLVAFAFSRPLRGLAFQYGQYGGTLNLNVNGQFVRVVDWDDLHGLQVGGVQVSVVPMAGQRGSVYLLGEVRHLAIGGQQLWIDNVCPATCCVHVELQPVGTHYLVGQTVPDPCAQMRIEAFTLVDGTVFVEGRSVVGAWSRAGGSGLELLLERANLALAWETPATQVRLVFGIGDTGTVPTNVNLRINGVMRNVSSLADLDGATMGGVQVSVVAGEADSKGRLLLDGWIHTMAVGGQELYLDDICAELSMRFFLPYVR
jgi:hypothetical protein